MRETVTRYVVKSIAQDYFLTEDYGMNPDMSRALLFRNQQDAINSCETNSNTGLPVEQAYEVQITFELKRRV